MQLSRASSSSLVLVGLFVLATRTASAKRNDTELLEDIKKYDKCVLQVQFSFINRDYNPPRTAADFESMCKRNTDGAKCIRERTKKADSLVRRGLLTMIGTRGRQYKRLCANPNSEQAKSFLAATECLMDKSFDKMLELDQAFHKSITAVLLRNYNDSKPELRQICCALHDLKQGCSQAAVAACPEHRAAILEFFDMMVTEDLTMVCEDEEKLSKSCPKLERLSTAKIPELGSEGPKLRGRIPPTPVTMLYLFATLGEASDTPVTLD